jgi:hypothetical protein
VKLFKIIPALIMLGGLGAVGNYGGDAAQNLLDRVRVLVTGLEVMNIAEEVRFHYLSYGEVPGLDDHDDFAQFLQGSFTPYYGSRQPSEDLFGNDYELDEAEGPEEYFMAIYSNGPNGINDGCALLDGTRQVTSQPGDAPGVASADDICVTLEHALRDTPYDRKNR